MLPYVVQTHAAMESIAAGNISTSQQTSHFPVFLPLVLVPARKANPRHRSLSTDTRLEPLLPGYLFVMMDIADAAWRVITSLRGVKGILGENVLSPTPIPVEVFDDFRRRFDAGEFNVPLPQAPEQIRASDHVVVQGGAFDERRGVCLLTRKQRAKILLPMLNGRTIETWVDLNHLRVDKQRQRA